MTRDDIAKLARQAELPACHLTHPKALERFALLVAGHERHEIVDQLEKWHRDEQEHHNYWHYAINYIRGRGQK